MLLQPVDRPLDGVTLDPSEKAARLIQVPGWGDGTLNVTAVLVFLSVLYVAFRSPGAGWC